MGYFSGLFPELDEPELEQQQVLGNPGSDNRRKNDKALEKSEQGLKVQREAEQPPEVKSEVVKSQADMANATSDAIKALDEAIVAEGGSQEGAGRLQMLHRARQLVVDRKTPAAKLADDLQQLGASTGNPKLLDASKKLANAHKGQQMIETLKAPGGALSVNPNQVGQQSAAIGAELQKKQQEEATTGEIRGASLRNEISQLKKDKAAAEQRENQYRILSDKSGAPQGMDMEQPVTATGQPKPPEAPNPNHMDDVFQNLGVNGWKQMVGTFAAGLSLTPFQLNAPILSVGPAYLRVLAAMDKKDVVAQAMNEELMAARREDQAQWSREDAKMSRSEKMDEEESRRLGYERAESRARRDGKEQQLKMLYARLKETPIMRTWYGMIAYVLLSILTRSPSFAARTLMGSQHPEVLGRELQRIQRSIEREDDRHDRLSQQYSMSRRQAIQNQQRREEVVGTREAAAAQRERQYRWDWLKLNASMVKAQQVAQAKGSSKTYEALKDAFTQATSEYSRAYAAYKDAKGKLDEGLFNDKPKERQIAINSLPALEADMMKANQKMKAAAHYADIYRKQNILPQGLIPEEAEAEAGQ